MRDQESMLLTFHRAAAAEFIEIKNLNTSAHN